MQPPGHDFGLRFWAKCFSLLSLGVRGIYFQYSIPIEAVHIGLHLNYQALNLLAVAYPKYYQ
jgi:hypothetical protein